MSNQGPSEPSPLARLRAADHDRFLQVLLAESGQRPALLALFLLNLELARIPDAVRDPMAGLIRLQWWRDGLGEAPGRAHPVLDLVAETGLRERLGKATLLALVEARERELDATPIDRVEGLVDYARATAGALNAAVARLCGAPRAVMVQAEAVGTAYGTLGIVRALPFVLRRSAGPFRAAEREALGPLVRAAVGQAEALLGQAAPLRGRRFAAPLVLGLLARQDAVRLAGCGFDPFDGRLAERPPWTVPRCLLAATVGRY